MRICKFASVILALALTLSCISGCTSRKTEALTLGEKRDLLQKAYTFSLPLLMVDATLTKLTNTEEATSTQAPVNQFIHANGTATAEFEDIVTPNADTVYSQICLDLSKDAVIVELPKTDRFCTVQVIDAYTNSVKIIDASNFEQSSQKFIFTYNFKEEIPKNITQVECPTPMAWIVVSTICNDRNDVANVHKLQEKMKSYTYTQLKDNQTNEKAKGSFKEENDFIPLEKVMSMTMTEYFTSANRLMKENPPAKADEPILKELAQIGVGPSLTFSSNVFGENAKSLWQETVANVTKATTENSAKFTIRNGTWSYMGKPIGEFGTEYDYRALIALTALGANPSSVAVCPKTLRTTDGERLNGRNSYILHFEKEQLPKFKKYGFWSVTAYNSEDNLLYANELERYSINDRSQVEYNSDGSLDIYISNKRPEERVSNWLPVPKGEFYLILRVYNPHKDIVENQWLAPKITKI